MAETTWTQVKHRFTGAVLYERAATADKQANRLAISAALEAATKSGADLCGAYLRGADLRGASLRGASLRGADLRDAYLGCAYLGAADLGAADLRGADLGAADLGAADLRGADLRDAYLRDAYLGGASLRGADLRGASLCGAYLRGADLGAADLGAADLRGADLGGGIKLVGHRPLLQIGPIGSRGDMLLVWLTSVGVRVSAGCFFGSRDEFARAVAEPHGGNSQHGREYAAALALIDAHAAEWRPALAPVADNEEAA